MKKITSYFLLIITVITLTACSTPLKKQELSHIKSVALINYAPQYPNLTFIGTTIFNNSQDSINELPLKEVMTNKAVEHLQSKGYQVAILESAKQAKRRKFDMIIELAPEAFTMNGLHDAPGSNGYGIYQRKPFGFKMPSLAYISFNLSVSIKKGRRYKRRDFSSASKHEKINMKITKKWSSLPPEIKQQLSQWLIQETKKSTEKMLLDVNL